MSVEVIPVRRGGPETARYFNLPPAYLNVGPYLSEAAPDVRFIKAVAEYSFYPTWFLPGLVMIVGSGGVYMRPHEQFLVAFDAKHEFLAAYGTVHHVMDIGSFGKLLRENPCP
jgi:hypothetical protein